MSVVSSVLSFTGSSRWKINDRLASVMDSIFAIGAGLGVRFIVDAATHQNMKLTSSLIGLWEGVVLLHFLKKMPRSNDPYIAYGVRLFVDFLVTESVARFVVVLIWTGMGMVLADIGPALWDDAGLKQVWRRFRRDMRTVSKVIPTVAFFPPARTVRFSPSLAPTETMASDPTTPSAFTITEMTPTTNPSVPLPPATTDFTTPKRRVPGYFPSGFSDTDSLTSIGSPLPIGRRIPSSVDPMRTSRRLSIYPSHLDDSDASSQNENDLDEANLSSSASDSDSTEIAAPSASGPIDTENIPEMDVEEEPPIQISTEPTKPEEEADPTTPRGRPVQMPPTPSDSAARWDRDLREHDEPLGPRPKSEFLPQIPDFLDEPTSEDLETIKKEDYPHEKELPPTPSEKDLPEGGQAQTTPAPEPAARGAPSPEEGGCDAMQSQFLGNNNDETKKANDTVESQDANPTTNTHDQPPLHRDSLPPPYQDDFDDMYGEEAPPDKPVGTSNDANLLDQEEARLREQEEKERILREEAEESSRKAALEEAERLKKVEEERKKAEEEEERKKTEEEERKKAEEEAERQKKEAEEKAEADRLKAEEEEKQRKREEKKQRKKEEAAERKRKEEADEAARKKKWEENAAAEAEKKRQEEEEKRAKLAEERKKAGEEAEARRQKAREEAEAIAEAKKRIEEETAEKKRREDEAAEQKRREDEAAEQKRREDEAAEQKRREDEGAEQERRDDEAAEQKRRDDEVAEQKRRDDEAAEKKRPEDSAEEKKRSEGEAAEKKQLDDEADAGQPNLSNLPDGPTNEGDEQQQQPPDPFSPTEPQDSQLPPPPPPESVASEASIASVKVEDRLQRMLLLRAQMVEIEKRIEELKEQGQDTAGQEKALRKMENKALKRYEEGTSMAQFIDGWDAVGEVSLDNMHPKHAEQKVGETLEQLLSPSARSLSLKITLARKPAEAKKQKPLIVALLDVYCLTSYTTENADNKKISEINIPEENFAEWLTGYRTVLTKPQEQEEQPYNPWG